MIRHISGRGEPENYADGFHLAKQRSDGGTVRELTRLLQEAWRVTRHRWASVRRRQEAWGEVDCYTEELRRLQMRPPRMDV